MSLGARSTLDRMKPELFDLTPTTALPPPKATSHHIRTQAMASTDPKPLSFWRSARVGAIMLSSAQRKQVTIVGRYLSPATAYAEVFAAAYVGLELAVACTTTENETGGPNIFQVEPTNSWLNRGPHGVLSGRVLTKVTAEWAFAQERAGATPLVGFGTKQLTSMELVAAANTRGGVWMPEHNCAEGDRFFLEVLDAQGKISNALFWAFYHYNGSGQAAVDYATLAVGRVAVWRERLG